VTAPAPELGILPPPPWRLKPAFVRRQRLWATLKFVGGAALAVLLWILVGDAASILSDEAIRAGPNVRVEATWDGEQQPGWKLFPTTTSGRVSYTQVDGVPCTRELVLRTTKGFPVERVHVFYDPADPARWTTSWSVEQATKRWLAIGQMLAGFGTLFGWLTWLGVRALAQLRLARLVAREGSEALGVFESAHDHHRHGRLLATRYRVRVTGADGEARRITVSYPPQQGRPLFLPNKRVLLLVAAHGVRALVLRHDLWPLWLTDEQLQRAVSILQRIDPTAGWRVAPAKGGLRLTCSPKVRPRSRA
jgi:hypothetical protein